MTTTSRAVCDNRISMVESIVTRFKDGRRGACVTAGFSLLWGAAWVAYGDSVFFVGAMVFAILTALQAWLAVVLLRVSFELLTLQMAERWLRGNASLAEKDFALAHGVRLQ